jgi:branched-chain amino acid transport system permease protein
MIGFASRHPIWSLIILLAVAVFAWMIFAPWPPGLEEALGRKRIFLNAIFGGITLGALYFLVASGFTLIFGLMRNVNLAHGSCICWAAIWVLRFPSSLDPGS